jgi:hypothetical protein
MIVPDEDLSKYATVPPPPMDCGVSSISFDSFLVRWTNPVFDGGLPIFDYELEIGVVSETRKGKQLETAATLLRTSRWCFDLPVASEQFKVTGMQAGMPVKNIRVRAINRIGPGHWSPAVSVVTLAG